MGVGAWLALMVDHGAHLPREINHALGLTADDQAGPFLLLCALILLVAGIIKARRPWDPHERPPRRGLANTRSLAVRGSPPGSRAHKLSVDVRRWLDRDYWSADLVSRVLRSDFVRARACC